MDNTRLLHHTNGCKSKNTTKCRFCKKVLHARAKQAVFLEPAIQNYSKFNKILHSANMMHKHYINKQDYIKPYMAPAYVSPPQVLELVWFCTWARSCSSAGSCGQNTRTHWTWREVTARVHWWWNRCFKLVAAYKTSTNQKPCHDTTKLHI